MVSHRISRLALAASLVTLVATLAACSKKEPATGDDLALNRSTPSAPAAESAGPAPAEPGLSPWDADLATLNDYLRREGLLGSVFFDYDQADLRPDALEQLARNAELLRERQELVVLIEGHCDERGTAEYNLALGDRRAHSVQQQLERLGVPTSRLRTMSYGKERPFCASSGEGCWSQNRRGHFVVVEREGRG